MVCATGQSGTAADRKHLFSQSEAALHWELRRERRAQREHPVPKNGVYGLYFSQPPGGSQDSVYTVIKSSFKTVLIVWL